MPAIVLRGAESGFGRPSRDPSGDQRRFPSLVARRIVDGAGHDLPAHRPDAPVVGAAGAADVGGRLWGIGSCERVAPPACTYR